MRKFALVLAMAVGLFVAAPASAGFDDAKTGLNGVLTGAFDPISGLILGNDALSNVGLDLGPATVVTDRVVGLVAGTFLGAFRIVTGALDVVCFPFTNHVGGAASPPAVVKIPGLTATP